MASDSDWIAKRVGVAREAHASVTDMAALRLTTLLGGELTERQLSTADLARIAKGLIADMTTPESLKAGDSR